MSFYPFSPVERLEINMRVCRMNVILSGINGVNVNCGSVLGGVYEGGIKLMNPCRGGIVGGVCNLSGEIIYVSCNPLTLKMDLNALNITKHQIKSIIPINQFPNTNHLEVIVHIQIP